MEDFAEDLVSIVIPVFNGARLVGEAIESALAQSWPATEIIVVDDGSNDGGATQRVLARFGDSIRVISKANGGVASALNAGIAAMRGRWFSWLSHDDLYHPLKVERYLDAMRQVPGPAIIFGNVDLVHEDGSLLSRRALTAAYAALGLDADADDDAATLLDSVGDWPLWPDVEAGLPAVAAAGYRVGVLSNVDDDVFARTRVAPLVEDDGVLTSHRLHAYKPAPELYRRALERAGGRLTHVATSARDVRGALEAGIDVVRLRRPGHDLDPDGPRPAVVVGDLHDVVTVLDRRRDRGSARGT